MVLSLLEIPALVKKLDAKMMVGADSDWSMDLPALGKAQAIWEIPLAMHPDL